MYLLYLDDAGSAANPSEQHLVLGGICVFEGQVSALARELDSIATSIGSSDPPAIEFHASEMFARRRAPWSGLTRDAARQTIKNVLSAMANAHQSTVAMACAVHKASYPGRDPMELAFEELCNRFDLFLKRQHARGNTQKGLIVLDESAYETSLQKLSHEYRRLGTRWGVVVNIPEAPLFVDSRVSRLIQLADHVAYSVFRYYEADDVSYANVILHRFDSENGRIHGLVHRNTTNANCMCHACLSRRLSER